MKLRWKILIALAVVAVLLTASLMVTIHVQPETEVAGYKRLLRERGEKLEIREVIPPPVAAESNGATPLRSAFSLLIFTGLDDMSNEPPAMEMVAPGKAMIGWAQSNLVQIGNLDSTNSWDNAEAAAEANHPAFEQMIQAASYPDIDFQPDYKLGPETPLTHLAPLRRCAQKLSAEAICDLHDGDSASAVTNICALLALAQAERNERAIISQMVRMTMVSIAASATWEFLQSSNATDDELAALQQTWQRQEYITGMEGAFEMERAMNDATIEKMRASDEAYARLIATSGGSGWLSFLDDMRMAANKAMWRQSWSYADQLRSLQASQILLDTLRGIQTNRVFQPAYSNAVNSLGTLQSTRSGPGWLTDLNDMLGGELRWMFSGNASATGVAIRRVMAAETARNVVVAAIALKRYQLRHGAFPENLSELAPEFLPSVPLDPVNGKALHYTLNTNGAFLLYSVGDDGVDDGGDATPTGSGFSRNARWNWLRGRDWVWPQPATPAEVEDWREHPPK